MVQLSEICRNMSNPNRTSHINVNEEPRASLGVGRLNTGHGSAYRLTLCDASQYLSKYDENLRERPKLPRAILF